MIKQRGTPPRAGHRAWRASTTGITATALVVAGAAMAPAAAAAGPDFGPNVHIFDPSMSVEDINAALQAAAHESEFSTNRHAFFFKPGTYGSAAGAADPATATGVVNGQVGYYETVAGLGLSPDDVLINGAIHAEGKGQGLPQCPWDGEGDTALVNFWRSLSNVSINPIQQPVPGDTGTPGVCYPSPENPDGLMFPEGTAPAHTLRWAVSQASPLRRVHVLGDLSLFPQFGGYSSGGFISDSVVDGTATSGSQQQYFTRNSQLGGWDGGVWNMVFSGVVGAPEDDFPDSATGPISGDKHTTLATTPVSREAPFLTWSRAGGYAVFVPAIRTDSSGPSWVGGGTPGESIGIGDFFVTRPSDSTAAMNAALASGKNLLLTPGVYTVDTPLNVTRDDTVILGLGMATLSPTAGNAVLTTGDVTGVKIAGITVDAGLPASPVLIEIGNAGAVRSDAADPTTLSDVFVRVGGPQAGSVDTAIRINSDGVLLDHIWSWRGDHGTGANWTTSLGNHGLVVNGDDVTATGLFVEHYQKHQVIWNGNGGRTVFYQSELPYEPPSQAAWSDGAKPGYASYKVSSTVTSHEAWGLGVYSYFNQGVDIHLSSAIEAPVWSTVKFHHAVTRFLNGAGGIDNVINDTGGPVALGSGDLEMTKYVREYPPAGTPEPPDGPADNEVTIQATVPIPAGEFAWSIDSPDHAVALSEAVSQGTYLQATGELVPIQVTDTRWTGPAWSISGQVSDFSGILPGSYLGWTPQVTAAGAGATAGAAVASGIDGGDGLAAPAVLGSAVAGHALGTATLGAGLDLRVPVDTTPGTYTATLTLTALS